METASVKKGQFIKWTQGDNVQVWESQEIVTKIGYRQFEARLVQHGQTAGHYVEGIGEVFLIQPSPFDKIEISNDLDFPMGSA